MFMLRLARKKKERKHHHVIQVCVRLNMCVCACVCLLGNGRRLVFGTVDLLGIVYLYACVNSD